MNRNACIAAIAGLALALPSLASAAVDPVDPNALPGGTFSPMVGFAFTTGGDTLVDMVLYSAQDGHFMGTDAVKAGGQDFAYLGGEFRPRGTRLAIQGTVGYHWSSKAGMDNTVTFSRVPIEVVGLYRVFDQIRFGAGARFDTRVHMNGAGTQASAPQYQQDYDNAFGGVLKAEWLILPDTGIELRYTRIHYKMSSIGGQTPEQWMTSYPNDPPLQTTFDGSGWGLGLNLHF
jgi:hypothetical protein